LQVTKNSNSHFASVSICATESLYLFSKRKNGDVSYFAFFALIRVAPFLHYKPKKKKKIHIDFFFFFFFLFFRASVCHSHVLFSCSPPSPQRKPQLCRARRLTRKRRPPRPTPSRSPPREGRRRREQATGQEEAAAEAVREACQQDFTIGNDLAAAS
jgi:hypothetical protein